MAAVRSRDVNEDLPPRPEHGGIPCVPRLILLLSTLAIPAHAALLAHVETTRGPITVELQFTKAPRAVANFMTLAEGTRPRLDGNTGAVIRSPLYVGERFFRVLDEAAFKIAQTGSGTGNNSGGPGFTFKDEFDPTLTHVPYVLSMANSGPNTNGSQIFFTGNATMPSLDKVHTVFGLVTDPTSRAVVDAIHLAGNDATTITGVTFERTDPGAVAFDPLAQNLPTLAPAGGSLLVQRGSHAIWNLEPLMNPGQVFRAYRSTTLKDDWEELPGAYRHLGVGTGLLTPVLLQTPLDDASNPRAFYHLSVATHPGSVAPSHLINRTMTLQVGAESLEYAFNADQSGGSTTYTNSSGSVSVFPFTTFDFSTGGHDVTLIVDHGTTSPIQRYVLVKFGCDSATSSTISGRHASSYYTYNPLNPWQQFAADTGTITR